MFSLRSTISLLFLTATLSAQNSNPFYFDDELEEMQEEQESYRIEKVVNSDDKTALKSITNPTEILNSVRGVYFNWNREKYPNSNLPSNRQTGIVAENLSSSLPGSQTKNKDGVTKTNNEALIALLIEVVKEQNVKIEELQASVIRYKTDMERSNHETTTYLSKVTEMEAQVKELKELVSNPVVNLHLHYDKKNRKNEVQPQVTIHQ